MALQICGSCYGFRLLTGPLGASLICFCVADIKKQVVCVCVLDEIYKMLKSMCVY